MYVIDKEQLLKESQELGFDGVELDSLFESMELDAETKTALTEAFTLASRNGAVQLVEAHLEQILESAQAQVEAKLEEAQAEYETKLEEAVDKTLGVIAQEWLSENEVAVTNIAKAELFESLMTGLKTTLIEHQVSIPDESIDLYDELVTEEKETRELANKYFKENQALQEQLNVIKRDQLIEGFTQKMTESQKDTFTNLAKAMKLDEAFEERLEVLSESFIAKKDKVSIKDEALVESLKQGSQGDVTNATDEVLTESQEGDKAPKTKKLSDADMIIRNI